MGDNLMRCESCRKFTDDWHLSAFGGDLEVFRTCKGCAPESVLAWHYDEAGDLVAEGREETFTMLYEGFQNWRVEVTSGSGPLLWHTIIGPWPTRTQAMAYVASVWARVCEEVPA